MAKEAAVLGTTIDSGASDWQIFQQDKTGRGEIRVSGRWGFGQWPAWKKFTAQVRLVSEDTGAAVTAELDWQDALLKKNGTWTAALKNIPAGGLYRLETRLHDYNAWGGFMGDCRHFLGVGDIWIITGQSNSAGYGREPVYDPPQLGVHVFNNAMRWSLCTQPANETTDTAHMVNREGYPQHGPWMAWAKIVSRSLGYPIGLIQVSLGGSPLSMWNPTEPGDSGLYDIMVQAANAPGGARGVLWYQGCSDAGPTTCKTYGKRFIAAVKAWRKALKNPDLHVLTIQLNCVIADPQDEADRGWSIIRETQRVVPKQLAGVTVVPTLDQPLSDGIHNSAHGNLLMAQRAAATALGAVYGKAIAWQAPEPATARKAQAGKAIDIRFANVTGQLTTVDGRASIKPFVVEDAQGNVPVEGVAYIKRDTIRLKLGRKLADKAVVHGGFGMNPPTVPHDQPRMLPILAFYGLKVK
ncbi:MAG: sialate O-acetylesterase [Planctomycetaceae bacterium]|nr:sialate O-acetylesterase [Planctomycetaceae bacterium]